jgi:hypothetical protein
MQLISNSDSINLQTDGMVHVWMLSNTVRYHDDAKIEETIVLSNKVHRVTSLPIWFKLEVVSGQSEVA